MRLTMHERKSVTKVTAARYQKATKKEKKAILNEFVQLTSYNRSYATFLLRSPGKQWPPPPKLALCGEASLNPTRGRTPIYDESVRSQLKKIWMIMDQICGKRLAPLLSELIPILERHHEINLDPQSREKLLVISPATIDRLLAAEKTELCGGKLSHTKPGTLLKSQIPVRTFSQWDEQLPGFVEIDLVGHEGGDARGDFILTLNVTDVLTGWIEIQAVRNKAQVWTLEALKEIRHRLPFRLRGIDSDNGSEFINGHLFEFCQQHQITFTRSRPYRKNDNCYVEQKNYSVVRRAVGYQRYEGEEQLQLLNQLYGVLRLYINYFQPVMKLVSKERIGSRVKKKYSPAQTPYRRVVESKAVDHKQKQKLHQEYRKLNPAELKRQITRLQNQLINRSKRAGQQKEAGVKR